MTGQTIPSILKWQAAQIPNSIALLAPGRLPLTYRSLNEHVKRVARNLKFRGVGRGDRVAIVLPNGPEMATTFLSVSSVAISAPLNPAYRAREFDFYLSDLNASAVVIQSGIDSPAREVAKARGISVIELAVDSQEPAGVFDLKGNDGTTCASVELTEPTDVALILHTSGTTSRPKIVPLTHKNLCTSAQNTKMTLELTEKDRFLNLMPLFHIHGLVAGILSSLTAGASIVCTSGFQIEQFFEWMRGFQPTLYSAVPSMHLAVLASAEANRDIIANYPLRLIRSSSSALPPPVMKGLEETFHVPVIEAYGMTEASHQIASNQLPPGQRKPGCVGVAAGTDVKIMDESGNILPAGQFGEIVISGENVSAGYENSPAANQNAFVNGWFRTGDQGVMDADGYLSITGRLKEMINRGGEKIAPREVDEVLLNHPDVTQALAFAVPHPTLGEDLAAAVVLRDLAKTTERELRTFAFSHLADFKVPSQIVIVKEIPKGPTGKLQRIGLHEKLGSNLKPHYSEPTNTLQELLAGIWARILNLERVGMDDNFFAAGGDSLSAASVVTEIEKLVNKKLEPALLFQAPTIDQLADVLQVDESPNQPYLLPVQPEGTKKPLFCVPGHGGDVFTYVRLAKNLQPDQPVYVFRFPEPARKNNQVANSMFKEMAAAYIKEMRALQPEGPYLIVGFCYGGEVAFEMAQQLHAQGQKTDLVVIIYAYLPGALRDRGFFPRVRYHVKKFLKLSARKRAAYVGTFARNVMERISRRFLPGITRPMVRTPQNALDVPLYYPGKITLFRPLDERPNLYHDPYMGWRGLAAQIELYTIPGDKTSIFKEPHVHALGKHLNECLKATQTDPDLPE